MFFESVFCLLQNDFFVAIFSVLEIFKVLISSLNSAIFFVFFSHIFYILSYFSFFISFACDGFRDGATSCSQKRLNGLDHRSFLCIFLLLGLELVFVKLGLLMGDKQ